MPGFVKDKKDEKKWAKAKSIAGKGPGGKPKYALANYLFHKMRKRMASAKEALADIRDPNYKPQVPQESLPATPEGVLYKDMLGDQMASYAGAKQRFQMGKQRLEGQGAAAPKAPASPSKAPGVGNMSMAAKPPKLGSMPKSQDKEVSIDTPSKLKSYKLRDFLQRVRGKR